MKQISKIFISLMVVISLFFTGFIGVNIVDASSVENQPVITKINQTETIETVSPDEGLVKDEDVEVQDWYTVSTEYGTPVARGDVTLTKDLPVDAYRNSSSLPFEYQRTHQTTYSSSWNAVAGVSIDLPKLNTKLNSQIGITGTKSYSYTQSFKVTVPSGKGVQIKRLYRKYEVPTYKVTKYSASMGGGTDKVLLGNTVVYVPVGMESFDY